MVPRSVYAEDASGRRYPIGAGGWEAAMRANLGGNVIAACVRRKLEAEDARRAEPTGKAARP